MIQKFDDSIVYFLSYSRLPEMGNASSAGEILRFGCFINYKTGEIVDITCTHIEPTAEDFLSHMIVGFNLNKTPLYKLTDQIELRFNGMQQKAIVAGLKSNFDRYTMWVKDRVQIQGQ